MMNRREFLVGLFGAASAAAILPHIDLLADTVPLVQREALTGPVWGETFRAAHREAHALLCEYMAGRGFPIEPAHCYDLNGLGTLLPSGDRLTTWRNIGFYEEDLTRECSIEPAMKSMADALASDGVDRYGSLAQQAFGVEYVATIAPLRMIVQYDIYTDSNSVRFDVIGGPSPQAKARAERTQRFYHMQHVKREIRRRLDAQFYATLPEWRI